MNRVSDGYEFTDKGGLKREVAASNGKQKLM